MQHIYLKIISWSYKSHYHMYLTVLLLGILVTNYKLLFTLGSMTSSQRYVDSEDLGLYVTVKILGFKKCC